MMISTGKCLDRRTFLRGAGAALALPFLDGMTPAFAGTASKPVKRLAVAYVPNGIIMGKWTPSTEGAGFDLPAILQPLAPFRDQLLVVSGLRSHRRFQNLGRARATTHGPRLRS